MSAWAATCRETRVPGKDGTMVDRHLNWKLGVVLVMAATVFAMAVLVVRSWAKCTYPQQTGQSVTFFTR